MKPGFSNCSLNTPISGPCREFFSNLSVGCVCWKFISVTLTAKCKRPTKSFRPPLPIRNRRRFATKAAWPGGEIAKGGAENGYATLVAPISGWRKVFCDGSKVDSAKVFAPGGSGPDGQSAFASDGRTFFQRDETSRRNGAITGASAAVAEFGRVGAWGKPVFRLTASSQLAESLARWRVKFQRDGTSTQAESRPGFAEWRRRSLVTMKRRFDRRSFQSTRTRAGAEKHF